VFVFSVQRWDPDKIPSNPYNSINPNYRLLQFREIVAVGFKPKFCRLSRDKLCFADITSHETMTRIRFEVDQTAGDASGSQHIKIAQIHLTNRFKSRLDNVGANETTTSRKKFILHVKCYLPQLEKLKSMRNRNLI
jgi:hypothetical protein